MAFSANESSNGLSNIRGSLSMARTSDPDSASSQFFINQVANTFLDWDQPWNKVVSQDFSTGDVQWFAGGKLNVSYNCIDRHLGTRGAASKPAGAAVVKSRGGERPVKRPGI